ncbi:spore germination protein GerPE [Paenibacillus sp. NPDC056579]|uniref:spore germination protein GerPE n=1 Tax=unclassified Paenibacillus TaxID=185978 RepID=UPI001EF860F3|nr:spore germination protein GerPE [Paenibacillus sp. H1-7]ULL15377.1 spore germination protein GerPE [Paenibacillus sp. H1-7]
MDARISRVGTINITTLGSATAMEIGDSKDIAPFNNTIAVQRERAVFLQSEMDFQDYSLFSRALAVPIVHEPIRINRINTCPLISVDHIHVFIISGSAVVHVGSSERLRSETRIKHIRHLLREEPAPTE